MMYMLRTANRTAMPQARSTKAKTWVGGSRRMNRPAEAATTRIASEHSRARPIHSARRGMTKAIESAATEPTRNRALTPSSLPMISMVCTDSATVTRARLKACSPKRTAKAPAPGVVNREVHTAGRVGIACHHPCQKSRSMTVRKVPPMTRISGAGAFRDRMPAQSGWPEIRSTKGPANFWSFAAPTPWTSAKASSDLGRRRTMSCNVRSWKTT